MRQPLRVLHTFVTHVIQITAAAAVLSAMLVTTPDYTFCLALPKQPVCCMFTKLPWCKILAQPSKSPFADNYPDRHNAAEHGTGTPGNCQEVQSWIERAIQPVCQGA